MLNRREALVAAMLASAIGLKSARAGGLPLLGPVTQGALLRGKVRAGGKVWLDGKPVTISSDGHYAIGFGHDHAKPATLRIDEPGQSSIEHVIELAKRTYKEQRISGLPDKYVEPPASVLARIERDNKLIGQARARATDASWFSEDFILPVKGPTTGVYGSQRILNGVPKRPHFGVDIAAGEGVPIKAPVGSIVSMADPDLYFTGGTVILDHCCGVSTSYLHMSRIDVKMGDKLNKGDVIGAVGKTGRATGPHLCWRLNWFAERLDAALVVAA